MDDEFEDEDTYFTPYNDEWTVDGVEVTPRFNSGMGGVTVHFPKGRGSLLTRDQAKALAVRILKAWDIASGRKRQTIGGHEWNWDVAIDCIDEWEANSRA